MFKGNWTCAKCGGAINELPFEPDPSRTDRLTCRDCHRESRGGGFRGNGDRRPSNRQMFTGNWNCADCGGSITELPFEPNPARTGELRCRDCHKGRM